jgi:two-component system, probable response regulator PhcQ
MQKPDFKKYFVLYVDDEEKSLKNFERAFGRQFKLLTAPSAIDAIKLIEQHMDDLAVLMTDQMMPGHKGVWLLDKARQMKPNILRILATAYSDLEAVIQAVNTGAIFHYVTKPWDPAQLENTLRHAMQLYTVQRERDQLLREKMSVLHNMMVSDRVMSVGFMAAGMSHHIRNSLVPVKTFIDLVPQQLADEGMAPAGMKNPEFWSEYQRTAQQHLEKINSLLRELWVVAESPAVAFTDRVHLRDVITEVTVRLRDSLAARSIAVEIQIPDSLPPLTVDKPKFGRIFDLLIRDEIVSLPEGSRLMITAALSQAATGERLLVTVRDDGPGLSENTLRTIFDPFNARSDSPSEHGISLMACYFIVHYHGGKIEARGGPGKGTEFQLDFPINGNAPTLSMENREFFQKLRANDELWEKLLSTR